MGGMTFGTVHDSQSQMSSARERDHLRRLVRRRLPNAAATIQTMPVVAATPTPAHSILAIIQLPRNQTSTPPPGRATPSIQHHNDGRPNCRRQTHRDHTPLRDSSTRDRAVGDPEALTQLRDGRPVPGAARPLATWPRSAPLSPRVLPLGGNGAMTSPRALRACRLVHPVRAHSSSRIWLFSAFEALT
jgi:hypothetical protein